MLLQRLAAFIAGWITGTLSTLLVATLLILLVGLMAIYAGWSSFSVGLGTMVIFEFTARTGTVLWAVESGPGMVLLSQLVGVLIGIGKASCLPRLGAQVRL